MNKSELIDAIAKDASITKVAAKAALESFISNVTSTLKEKAEGFNPAAFADVCEAYKFLISSQALTYVTGFERDERPIGF